MNGHDEPHSRISHFCYAITNAYQIYRKSEKCLGCYTQSSGYIIIIY